MMWAIIGFFAVVAIAVYRVRSAATVLERRITLDQIEAVYDSLQRTGADHSYAILVPAPRPGEKAAASMQFSMANGNVGLDWILDSPISLRDRDKFVARLDASNAAYQEILDENLPYLRTEDSRAPVLCREMLQEAYGLSAESELSLLIGSFHWPHTDKPAETA